MKIRLIWLSFLISLSVAGCSNMHGFLSLPNTQSESEPPVDPESDDAVDQPQMIGGTFLCSELKPNPQRIDQDKVGCRIDKDGQKVPSAPKDPEVNAQDANGNSLKVESETAPEASDWHWFIYLPLGSASEATISISHPDIEPMSIDMNSTIQSDNPLNEAGSGGSGGAGGAGGTGGNGGNQTAEDAGGGVNRRANNSGTQFGIGEGPHAYALGDSLDNAGCDALSADTTGIGVAISIRFEVMEDNSGVRFDLLGTCGIDNDKNTAAFVRDSELANYVANGVADGRSEPLLPNNGTQSQDLGFNGATLNRGVYHLVIMTDHKLNQGSIVDNFYIDDIILETDKTINPDSIKVLYHK